MPLPSLPVDKANHAIYGMVVFVVGGALAHHFGVPRPDIVGVLAAIVAGVLKELADAIANWRAGTKAHAVELWDATATAAGGILAWLAAQL